MTKGWFLMTGGFVQQRNTGVAVRSLKVSGQTLILGAVFLPIIAPSFCDDHYCWKWRGTPISPTSQATYLWRLSCDGQGSTPTPEQDSRLPVITASRPTCVTEIIIPLLSGWWLLFLCSRPFIFVSYPHIEKTLKFLTRGISFSCCYRWSDQWTARLSEFLQAPASISWGLQTKKRKPQKPDPPVCGYSGC